MGSTKNRRAGTNGDHQDTATAPNAARDVGLSIAQAAACAGVTAKKIDYWQRRGYLSPIPGTWPRRYRAEDVLAAQKHAEKPGKVKDAAGDKVIPWAAIDRLLGTDTDRAIAEKTGWNEYSIARRRRELGIPPAKKGNIRKRIVWETYDHLLGTMSDIALAAVIGCTAMSVFMRRKKLGLRKAGVLNWEEIIPRLGKESDVRIAKDVGCMVDTIFQRRKALGIPPYRIKRHEGDSPRICDPEKGGCGASFQGAPRAWVCPECSRKRRNEYARSARERAQRGEVRAIGSLDTCKKCGQAYTVESAGRRYCSACARKLKKP